MPDPAFALAEAPAAFRYETEANNGHYLSVWRRERVPPPRVQALWQLSVPRADAQLFGTEADLRSLGIVTDSEVRLPVLEPLLAVLPADAVSAGGWCLPTSSPRTVVPWPQEASPPWVFKLHGQGGKRIEAHDAQAAPVFSELLASLEPTSAYLAVIAEPCSVVVRPRFGGTTLELGAIFRRWPPCPVVPAFAIYSAVRGRGGSPLGLGLWRAAGSPEPVGWCLERFVTPLLDVFFGLASRGVTLQLHAQNLLFDFDDETHVRRVWVRDVAGLNYAPRFRAEHGLPDLLPAALAATPGATSALMERWLGRQGSRRRLFDERFVFGHAYDTQLSAFWFQLMWGLFRASVLSRRDLPRLRRAIQAHARAAADHFGFDTELLLPRFPPPSSFLRAALLGLERRPLFRPVGS